MSGGEGFFRIAQFELSSVRSVGGSAGEKALCRSRYPDDILHGSHEVHALGSVAF